MILADIPDLHLNKSVYKVMDKEFPTLPFRNVDFMKAFEHNVDKCINELKVEIVVIPGDIYDNFNPSNEVRGFFSRQLRKLNNAHIPVIILVGNHEICQKHHALKDIKELALKNIMIVEEPTIFCYKGHNLFLFPYSIDVEQKKVTIKESFVEFKDKIEAKRKSGEIDTDLPSIFFGHFGVRGAQMNEYTDTFDKREILGDILETDTTITDMIDEKRLKFVNNNPNDIGTDDLDSLGVDYVLLGHYHRFQTLNTQKCFSIYAGSAEKTDMTEIDQKKGFVVYDSEAKEIPEMGKCKFVEYPHCRPIMELKGSLNDMREKFCKIDVDKHQGAIVKLSFIGTPDELIDFSVGMPEFKKELLEKINPIHMFHVQSVTNPEEEEKVSELEKQILAQGHLGKKELIQIVREIIPDRFEDEEEINKTMSLFDDISSEVMG